MTAPTLTVPGRPGPGSLALALGCALGLRVLAALLLDRHVASHAPQNLCLFPDTRIYWALAQTIRAGQPYQVSLWGVPHYALRTPGYPLFLAGCQALFGERTLPVRLVQALVGVSCPWLLYRLMRRLRPVEGHGHRGTVPFLAAWLVALDPFAIVLAVLLLSESVFVPLMLLGLWGMSGLWAEPEAAPPGGQWLRSLAAGAATGAAILIRPSWALFLPIVLVLWVLASEPTRRTAAVRGALGVALGTALVMAPWWVRNDAVFGRFVPTALWMGPSLYDGLHPGATGKSDMRFLDDPQVRILDEPSLDATLTARAWAFARSHPVKALRLALVKSARFWSPWPNAETLSSPLVAVASAVVSLSVYALMIVGGWELRRDFRALVLLAGPLLYFWVLHMLFVGSIRYRIPGAIPALGLAAVGAFRLVRVRPAGR